ncbi:Retrovirus-related Pol polyprotein from transposon 17.6, partial [Mucuna pruriens]
MRAAEGRENELRQQIAAMRASRDREEEPEEVVTTPFWGQPFCKEIDETSIPPNFREIVVEPFDGSQDPHAHLQAFQTQIYISDGNDRLSCKLFPGTLRGVAMQWMSTLPPRSIQTFRDLATSFLSQFAANKRLERWRFRPKRADGYKVERVLVDQGSSVNILYKSTLEKMQLKDEVIRECSGNLRTFPVLYTIVDAPASYNVILGRPALNKFGAIVSTKHLCMKFPVGIKVGSVWADAKTARKCYEDSLKVERFPSQGNVNILDLDLDPRGQFEKEGPLPAEELKEITLGLKQDQTTKIGTTMNQEEERMLIAILTANRDIFAWTAQDMPGVDPEFMSHQLSVNENAKPISQKKRKMGEEKREAASQETRKLMAAGFVREVQYPTWLANVVMVRKASGKWRMCTDYTDLNKACPKDSYPLPGIDRLVDGVAGYAFLSFMDAYSGYNQIRMHPQDEEKTAFITDEGAFCYKVMPFGLKNAGATYQRLMDKIFKEMLGRDVEVYVDDMVARSQCMEEHCVALGKIFGVLRKHKLRLNPSKCSFGVKAGKFLGFMLTERGIEANLEKCQAIINIRSPRSVKEVQQFLGKLTSLARFISKSAKASIPLFATLKKGGKFAWTDDCEEAFLRLKTLMATPSVLTRPRPGTPLCLYISISDNAVSSVLVQEEGGEQKPVYFTSRVLQGPERRYQKIEKAALAVVVASRRLRPYFQSYSIIVRTDLPIKQVLRKPDLAGRMVAWSIQLSEFDISFEGRGHIRAQVLADFVNELSPKDRPTEGDGEWYLSVDGSTNQAGSGAGVILEGPGGILVEQSLHFNFKASNNQAEYEALLAGMRLARELEAKILTAKSDSRLVTGQVNDEYQTRDPQLCKYRERAVKLATYFEKFKLVHVPREQNERADLLAKLASTQRRGQLRSVIHENVESPTINEEEVCSVEERRTWMTPLIKYLNEGRTSESEEEGRRLSKEIVKYTLIGGRLYRRGFAFPLLKCLNQEEAAYAMKEVHEGVCGSHIGGRALASKVARAGYYWPTIKADCMNFVQRCNKCQKFAEGHKAPPEVLHSLTSPWPFSQWGINILGPFPIAPGQIKFLVVAVDYFTKWIEAEPVAVISAERIKKFLWKKIICRFGLPAILVSDNGTQFASKITTEFCQELGIKQVFTSVEHPQTNGQAEAANKVILRGLRRRLEEAKGRVAEELPQVLWSYHTTPHSSTDETPFRLVFGTEAVIPVEVGEPSTRVEFFEHEANEDELRANLDLLQEVREAAHIREFAVKARVARLYNRRVIPREFEPQDLVLRRMIHKADSNKLTPKWEGPFRIRRKLCNGAYKLETLKGKEIPRTWNAASICMYYS